MAGCELTATDPRGITVPQSPSTEETCVPSRFKENSRGTKLTSHLLIKGIEAFRGPFQLKIYFFHSLK